MRHEFFGIALIVAVISGTAAAAGPAPFSGRDLNVNEGRLDLNVKGGYYSEVEVKAEKSQDFVMMLSHRNPHEKWAASSWVCLLAGATRQRVCANLSWPDPEVDRLVVEQSDKTDKNITHQVQMGTGYFPDQEVKLTLRINDGEAQFQVGDDIVKRPLDFKPERVTLGCSSAECIFTLL